ncbi:MAG: tetratricopeptide repeat protein [Kofleriaceae bacterium]
MTKLIPLLLSIGLGGCFWATTKSEGESLRKDVTTLQAGLGDKQKEAAAQVEQLKQVLEDATKLLKRNSADLGADVDQLRADVRTASGLVVTVNNTLTELKTAYEAHRKANEVRLDSLEQRLGQLESGKPSANSSPDDLWKLGSTAFEAGRYNDAVEIFKRLSASFPTHERADDAIYFKGQAYTNLKDWEKAIGSYQQLADKFPDGPLTDDGYYFAALAAQQLKQCGEARAYLDLLKKKFPKSNVSKQGASLDAQLKKDAKIKTKCAA